MGILHCASITLVVNGAHKDLDITAESELELYEVMDKYDSRGGSTRLRRQYLYDTVKGKIIDSTSRKRPKSTTTQPIVTEQQQSVKPRRTRIITYV